MVDYLLNHKELAFQQGLAPIWFNYNSYFYLLPLYKLLKIGKKNTVHSN